MCKFQFGSGIPRISSSDTSMEVSSSNTSKGLKRSPHGCSMAWVNKPLVNAVRSFFTGFGGGTYSTSTTRGAGALTGGSGGGLPYTGTRRIEWWARVAAAGGAWYISMGIAGVGARVWGNSAVCTRTGDAAVYVTTGTE